MNDASHKRWRPRLVLDSTITEPLRILSQQQGPLFAVTGLVPHPDGFVVFMKKQPDVIHTAIRPLLIGSLAAGG